MNSAVISICAAVAVLLAIGPVARPARVADRPVTSLGRILRTAAGRAPDPVRDARVGRCALAVALCLVVGVVPALGLLCAWALAARWRHLRRAQAEPAPLLDDLPEVIDLLRLSLGAGLTIPAALPVLARWAPPHARAGLSSAARSVDRGVPVATVLADLSDQWGEPARPLLRAIADHVRNGAPLVETLRRLGDDARSARRRAAERRARRLPVLLLFPLVCCTLPAFGLLTVAPIVAGTLRSLDEGRLETPVSSTYRWRPRKTIGLTQSRVE